LLAAHLLLTLASAGRLGEVLLVFLWAAFRLAAGLILGQDGGLRALVTLAGTLVRGMVTAAQEKDIRAAGQAAVAVPPEWGECGIYI